MTTIAHVGPGVEIEDDAVRLRRRKVEFEDDAARWAHRSGPRLRRRKSPSSGQRDVGGGCPLAVTKAARC